MRMLCLSLAIVLLLASFIPAQKAPQPAVGAVLTEEDGSPVAGVRLASAELKAVVHGSLAQETMTLTFSNDQPRVLGGNLAFPLPQGATVTGYGLEIDGRMVEGVAVEKERARIIYESEIHKRIDPGMVENVAGNAFRTRLYPIPASGRRSIRIEYVTQIEQNGPSATLSLPMSVGEGTDEVSVAIEAPEAGAPPQVQRGLEGLAFAPGEHGFAAIASLHKPHVGQELVIAFPEFPQRSMAVEKRRVFPRTEEELPPPGAPPVESYEHYFLLNDTPDAMEAPAENRVYHSVGVVWDASLSRADADHARELKILEAALHRLGDPNIDLIVLRNDRQVQSMGVGPDGVHRLIQTLGALAYDGATNLGSLILPKNPADYRTGRPDAAMSDYDCFLLFTDGLGNLGPETPLRAEAPVYALCDASKANHPLLQRLCQESGGRYFNLRRSSDEQAISGIGQSPFSLVSIGCNPREIAEVYPPAGAPVEGRITVAGKLLAPTAQITLNYGVGHRVLASRTFTLSAQGAEEGTLAPRYWAQCKSAALSLFPARNGAELSRLGRDFNLVTPNTSLLVLETAAQYAQYHVAPPIERKEIYAQYLALAQQRKAEQSRSQEQKLGQVAMLWNGRVQWWEKQYDYPKDLKVAPDEGKQGFVGGSGGAGDSRLANAGAAGAQQQLQTGRPTPEQDRRAHGPRDQLQDLHSRMDDAPASSDGADRPRSPAPRRPPVGLNNPAERGVGERGASPIAGGMHQEAAAKKGADEKSTAQPEEQALVQIKPWDPATPYIAAMKAAGAEKAYDAFLSQRAHFGKSPAFYFDCADYLFSIGQRDLGIRVLSDIVELELDDARLIRVAAHRLNQVGEREMAIDLFEKVMALRPEEPQSYRDLALALADRADALTTPREALNQEKVDSAIGDYSRAMQLLNKVVLGDWPRFPEVELPVLMEANNILAKVQRLPAVHDFHNPLDERLVKNLDLDVRVVMTWDADQTDIDLWVTEPSGEKCFYGHNRTVIGGLLSHDFTDGYGPEEYCLRKLMPGQYQVQANFFGSRQQELTGPATVQATVITNFGRPTEKRQSLSLRLKDVREVVDLGNITLGAGGQ